METFASYLESRDPFFRGQSRLRAFYSASRKAGRKYLDRFILQAKTIKRADCLLGIVGPVVVDEAVTQTLSCNTET